MRIGLDHYTIAHRGLEPEEALAFAEGLGLEGVQFLEPSAVDERLDHSRLIRLAEAAEARGMYVEIGVPCPNPFGGLSPAEAPVEPRARAGWFRPRLEAANALGARAVRAFVGSRHDRFRTDVSWAEQRRATAETLRAMTPDLERLGMKVALETHADLTVDELLELIEQVGAESVGVTLDTGNLPMRLEDPLEAVERLAPFVLMTHVKDAVLGFTERGLRWQARPVGNGGLPIAAMIGALRRRGVEANLSIELHPRIYDLPIFDPTWLAFFPGLRPSSLAAAVRLAWRCERRWAEGTLPTPEEVEAVPWGERDREAIERSSRFLRRVLEAEPA